MKTRRSSCDSYAIIEDTLILFIFNIKPNSLIYEYKMLFFHTLWNSCEHIFWYRLPIPWCIFYSWFLCIGRSIVGWFMWCSLLGEIKSTESFEYFLVSLIFLGHMQFKKCIFSAFESLSEGDVTKILAIKVEGKLSILIIHLL